MASESYNKNSFDFIQMERDLYAALDADNRQQLENDAKIRAVSQRLSSYEEFKDFVKGAHLRPIERSGSASQRPKSSLWNLAHKKRSQTENEMITSHSAGSATIYDGSHLPTSAEQFLNYWRNADIVDRLSLLLKLGPAGLGHLFRVEIPADILGEILQTLIAFNPNTSDIITVVGVLEALTEIKRFNLSLQFLSALERSTCCQLMEKLFCSLNDRQQDLAEHGITEWTLQELKKKYFV